MSEPIKNPIKVSLESYNPKTPKFINIVEQAAEKNNKVITTEKGAYIDGVPSLGFDIPWRNCSFSASMTLLLNALGADATYERVMGLTGSCWRAGSTLVDDLYAHQGGGPDKANMAYGLDDGYIIHDAAERDMNVQRIIDMGIPVLVLEKNNKLVVEWAILTGYEKRESGVKFFGRSYSEDGIQKSEIFTDNRYAHLDYPGHNVYLYDKPCEPLSGLYTLKGSLEKRQTMFKPHDKYGFAAYDIMAKDFEYDNFKWIGKKICALVDARRAAYIYLNESAGLLSDTSKDNLFSVSSLYKDMFDTLQGVMPYEQVYGLFYENSMPKEMRKKFAEALRKCQELEHQAHSIVDNILENWEN